MFTKDTYISDILALYPIAESFFLSQDLHCAGCPSSSGDTIEIACEIHGIDINSFINELNAYLGLG